MSEQIDQLPGGPEPIPANSSHALKAMTENGIVLSGDALTLGIGAMTDARWERFYNSMTQAGVIPAGVDFRKAYSLEFVNKGVGKA